MAADDGKLTPARRGRWGRRLLLLLLVGVVAAWLAVSHRPSWWTAGGDRSEVAEARGVAFENAMVSRMTEVRDDPAPWGFIVTDADVNAWLANRLVPWVESRGDVDLPPGIDDPRMRFIDGGIEVGVSGPLGGVATARFAITLDGDDLVVTPTGGGLGWISLGEGTARSTASTIAELLGGSDGVRVGDLRLDPEGEIRMKAAIPLSDGRRVEVDDLEIVAGEFAVRFRTVGR